MRAKKKIPLHFKCLARQFRNKTSEEERKTLEEKSLAVSLLFRCTVGRSLAAYKFFVAPKFS